MKNPIVKKSVLVSWILSYWAVLILSLLASLLIYSSANQALNNEIEKVELSVLDNTQNLLDSRLAEIELTASLLQRDRNLKKFAHAYNPFYKTDLAIAMSDGKERMVQVANNNLNIDSIYLYSLNSHVILSTQYGINDPVGYKLPAEDAFGISFEAFEAMIDEVQNERLYRFLPALEPNGIAQILLFYPVIDDFSRIEGVLILVIDASTVFSQEADNRTDTDFELVILAPGNQNVYFGQEAAYQAKLDYDSLADGTVNLSVNNEELLISSASSSVNNWKYVLVANLDVFQASILQVRNMMLIFFLIFLLLGTVASILLAYRNYSPVKRLLNRAVQLSDGAQGENTNEYQQLESAIQGIYREKETYSRLVDRQRVQMTSIVLNRLLKGRMLSTEQAADMLSNEGIHFGQKHYVLIMMNIEDFGVLLSAEEADPTTLEAVELSQVIIKNVLEELFAEQVKALVFEVDAFLACLINFDYLEDVFDAIEATLKKGFTAIYDYFSIVISASISDVHEGLIGVSRCYTEALESLEDLRNIAAPGEIVKFADHRDNSSQLLQSVMHLETRRILLNYLVVEDYESAETIVEDFLNVMDNKDLPAPYRKIAQSGLIEDLSAALDAVVGNIEDLKRPDAEALITKLLTAESLPAFRALLKALFVEIRSIRDEKDRLYQHDAKLNQILEYINEHISDYDLSVSGISDSIGLSVSQIARLFRNKLGQGTLDYIQKTRIEKAKRLLEQTSLNVSEISRRVGYENFRTMNSIFKKIEGITGSQYREHYKRKNRVLNAESENIDT